MRLFKHEYFEINAIRSGKGEKWHWKPKIEMILLNFHKVENGKGFKYVNTWSYFLPGTIRVFWFGLLISLKLKSKLISGETPKKYVEFEKTHLELMGLPEGNWCD